jgi:hypothetical protein
MKYLLQNKGQRSKKNYAISKLSCNLALPHQLTFYAVNCVLQLHTSFKDTVEGAGNCVGWCGNYPTLGHLAFSNRKSYQS